MKLLLGLVVAAASLTGCAIVPAPYGGGPQAGGYGGYGGPVVYGPAVTVVPAPVVVTPRFGFGFGHGGRGRRHW